MEIPSNFQYKTVRPDMSNIIKFSNLKSMSELNCLKIATVVEFHPDDLTVTVNLLNKKTLGDNKDGTPNVRDYALIRAKVCFCNPYITFPINVGDDCLILFSDREIESWFINGDAQPVNYTRMHDLTDAFAIFGIRSIPKMIEIATDCLNLMYKGNSIQIKENGLTTGGEQCIADGEHSVTNGSVITTKNGIITSIT